MEGELVLDLHPQIAGQQVCVPAAGASSSFQPHMLVPGEVSGDVEQISYTFINPPHLTLKGSDAREHCIDRQKVVGLCDLEKVCIAPDLLECEACQ
jgi:hypothetical protein